MTKLYDPFRNDIAQLFHQIVTEKFQTTDISVNEIAASLVEPPNSGMGDLAFGCFILSKKLKKSPADVAKSFAAYLEENKDAQNILLTSQAVGPYLNLFLSKKVFESEMDRIISGAFFQQKLFANTPKTMVEYSQPNTHKELHVGHMRNMCLGDSLIRLFKYSGYDIVSSTFPGDVGTHVAKCLWYLKTHNKEPMPSNNQGEWLGRMYSLANNRLEDEKGTPQEEVNRQALTLILKQLEEKKGEYFDLWKVTREWSIELMKQVYAWAGVDFDMWYWESDVDSDSVKYIKSLFDDKKLVESQGAIGMNLEEDNLGFCLLLKSDGTGLYATKDIELARRKFQDFKIEKSIYVVDMRQALHFKQVFKVLEKLGFSQAKDCFHLQYNFVELPDGPMSSRKGNIVPITRLISQMQKYVKEEFLARYENEWPADEIELVSKQVAQGAIKYGMLRMDNNKKIVFNMTEWLKIDGESGPFIQYSAARIQSLTQKLNYQAGPIDASLLNHASEKAVLAHLLNFNLVVSRCTENLTSSPLCTYLYQLAQKFNHFYHECSIGQAETEDLKKARLKLAVATGEVLKQGLALLGVPTPRRM